MQPVQFTPNPVQNAVMNSILLGIQIDPQQVPSGLNLMGGADEYDFANYIAALRKAADYIEKQTNLNDDFIKLAMKDWITGQAHGEEKLKDNIIGTQSGRFNDEDELDQLDWDKNEKEYNIDEDDEGINDEDEDPFESFDLDDDIEWD